jgi:hypothetical protein
MIIFREVLYPRQLQLCLRGLSLLAATLLWQAGAVASRAQTSGALPDAPASGENRAVSPDEEGKADCAGASVASLWTEEQTPVDFLDAVGQLTKARWRQLYRPPPPTPAPDRMRTAVTLGYLVGESFLCVQAVDAQQFRNNNQEVTTFCRTLGFGEKVAPLLLNQARLAEAELWEDLRSEVIRGHQELDRALRDQRDEELAELLRIGVWLRTLEIVSTIVVETPDTELQGICVGSPVLVETLREAFGNLSEQCRATEVGREMGSLLDFLWRNWARSADAHVTEDVVQKTHERLAQSARKLSLR